MDSLANLLAPKQVLVLDLLNYVQELERNFRQYFREPEPGIYLSNGIKSVLSMNQLYYSESSYLTQTPITQLDKVQEAVLNAQGEVVIPRAMMRRQQTHLRKQPTLPVRAIHIAAIAATAFLEDTAPYKPCKMAREEIRQHLKPEGQIYLDHGYIDASCGRLFNDLSRFVGNDVWNIYFTRLANTDLIIEKASDYRIYEYTRQMELGTWSKTLPHE